MSQLIFLNFSENHVVAFSVVIKWAVQCTRVLSDISIHARVSLILPSAGIQGTNLGTLMRGGWRGNGGAGGCCTKTEQKGIVTRKRGTCRVREKTVRFKMPLTTGHTPLSQCLQRICLRAPMRRQFSAVFPTASRPRLYTRREINVSYMLSASPQCASRRAALIFACHWLIFNSCRLENNTPLKRMCE